MAGGAEAPHIAAATAIARQRRAKQLRFKRLCCRGGLCDLADIARRKGEYCMRDQYAGDVSDVIKFAFLRALAGQDKTLGIAWYYAPSHDGRLDGRHLEWRDEKAWRALDEELHAGLANLPERSVAALEQAMIWPEGTLFHREPVPPRLERHVWGMRKRHALDAADILFLDPDNGIGGETEKHATLSEVRLLRKPGRAIVFITFPGRNLTHDALLQQLHERLSIETGTDNIATLRTNVSVPRAPDSSSYVQRQRWFTIMDPDADLIARAHAFATALANVPRVRAKLERWT
ncbi:hypothetical protein [Breoghania sp. JC706]|uniref:hypothetical protein n=1 Tax=Breoghania sp. JC706 TaxID=3117732 RepID=UPI003009CDA6